MEQRETAVPEQGEVKPVEALVDAYHHLLDSTQYNTGAAGWVLLAARARVMEKTKMNKIIAHCPTHKTPQIHTLTPTGPKCVACKTRQRYIAGPNGEKMPAEPDAQKIRLSELYDAPRFE